MWPVQHLEHADLRGQCSTWSMGWGSAVGAVALWGSGALGSIFAFRRLLAGSLIQYTDRSIYSAVYSAVCLQIVQLVQSVQPEEQSS